MSAQRTLLIIAACFFLATAVFIIKEQPAPQSKKTIIALDTIQEHCDEEVFVSITSINESTTENYCLIKITSTVRGIEYIGDSFVKISSSYNTYTITDESGSALYATEQNLTQHDIGTKKCVVEKMKNENGKTVGYFLREVIA